MAFDLPLAVAFLVALISSWNGVSQDVADRSRADMHQAASTGTVSAGDGAAESVAASGERGLGIVLAEGAWAGIDWRWRAGRVRVSSGPEAGGALRVVLDEPQRITLRGGGAGHRWILDGETLDLRLAMGPRGTVTATTLTGANVTLVQDGQTFTATHLRIDMTSDDTTSDDRGNRRITLTLEGVTLPPAVRPLDHVQVVALISAIGRDPPATLTEWRDRGGSIHIVELVLNWARFHLDAAGRLDLDDRLRPRGRLRVGLSGAPDAVQSAEAAGWVGGGTRKTVEDALARIAGLRGVQDANAVRLDLSLKLAGGRLNWQGLPVAALPTLGTAGDCETDDAAPAC